MSDILSFGRDRPPHRKRPWRLAVAAAGLAAVLVAALIWYLPGARPHRAQAGPTAAPSPVPPTKPARMTGQPLPRDASLSLLLGGRGPAWLRVATGRTEPIRGLPHSGNGYQFVRIAGGWAAQPFPVEADCDGCAPGPLPVYYLADGSRVASRIGAADFVAPAAAPGSLWLVSYQRSADMRTAAGHAQEVSVTGAALGSRLRLPAGFGIDQGTRAGLLLVSEAAGSGPVRYELWDPGTGQVSRSFVNLIAASPAEIAWVSGCAAVCHVRVLDMAGGRAAEMALPRRSTTYGGAFSPDGRFLALLVTARITRTGVAAAIRLMVATVASGRIAAVPGSTVGSGIGVDFGWQAGSHRLIAGVPAVTPGQTGWQVAVWQPGDARLSTALVQVADDTWPVIDQGPY